MIMTRKKIVISDYFSETQVQKGNFSESKEFILLPGRILPG